VLRVLTSLAFVYIDLNYLQVGFSTMQTMLFLKLAITGHFLLYAIHARGKRWFQDLPSKTLLAATMGTQLIASIIAMAFFGLPLWLLLFTWAFAFVAFNITDALKVVLFKDIWTEGK
jgi:hypothetical protein